MPQADYLRLSGHRNRAGARGQVSPAGQAQLRGWLAWFIADAGANPRELMARMVHDSARAALIYLHSSAERQRALANEVGKNARAALSQPHDKPKRSGTRKARNRREAS